VFTPERRAEEQRRTQVRCSTREASGALWKSASAFGRAQEFPSDGDA